MVSYIAVADSLCCALVSLTCGKIPLTWPCFFNVMCLFVCVFAKCVPESEPLA